MSDSEPEMIIMENKPKSKLQAFLEGKKTEEDEYNVYSPIGQNLRYNISTEQGITTLGSIVSGRICGDTPFPHKLMFRPPKKGDITRFRFDIDLSKPATEFQNSVDEKDRLWETKELKAVVRIINEVITSLFTVEKTNLDCYVLTKHPYIDTNKRIKHGFHLEYPKICALNSDWYKPVSDINMRILRENIFGEHFKQDLGFINNAWLLYGGTKPKRNEFYEVEYKISPDLKVSRITSKRENYLKLFWLYPFGDFTPILRRDFTSLNNIQGNINVDLPDREDKNEIEYIKGLFSTLNPSRVEERQSWYNILHGVKNHLTGLKVSKQHIKSLLQEWSKTTTKGNYSDEGFKLYFTKEEPKITIENTLYRYWRWDNKNFNTILYKEKNEGITQVIMDVFGDNIFSDCPNSSYIYTYSPEKRIWTYTDIERDKVAFDMLFKTVVSDVFDEVRKLINIRYKRNESGIDGDKKSEDAKKEKEASKQAKLLHGKISSLSSYLDTVSGKKDVCTVLCGRVRNSDKVNLLNSAKNLLPIKGGKVIDLTTGEIRDRTREDYFTFESPISKTDDLEFGDRFFLDISNGRPELALDMKKIFTYLISGFTFQRSYFQFIGEVGRNGKSTFMNAIDTILTDELSISMDTNFLQVSKKSAGDASPHMEWVAKKRCVFICETNRVESIDPSFIKKISGADSKTATRTMYKKEVSKSSKGYTFRVIIGTNFPISVNDAGQAFKDRGIYVPFEHRFDKNEAFMTDLLANKNGRLDSVFSSALIASLPYMKPEGEGKDPNLRLGNIITEHLEKIYKEQNTLCAFLDTSIEEGIFELGKELYITTTELKILYDQYCNDTGGQKINDKDFKKTVLEHLPKVCEKQIPDKYGKKPRCFSGIGLKTKTKNY